jgi:hypothetical protein
MTAARLELCAALDLFQQMELDAEAEKTRGVMTEMGLKSRD